jgi:hypothetical protein
MLWDSYGPNGTQRIYFNEAKIRCMSRKEISISIRPYQGHSYVWISIPLVFCEIAYDHYSKSWITCFLRAEVVHRAFGRSQLNVNARQRTSGKLIQH